MLATDYLESEEASPSGSLLRPHGYAGRAAPEDWLGSIFSGTDGVLFVASGDPASTAADEAIMRRSREVATAKGYDFDVLPLVVLRTSSGTRPASESAAALGIAGRPMVEDDVEKAHALLLAEIVRALAAGTLRHMPAPAREEEEATVDSRAMMEREADRRNLQKLRNSPGRRPNVTRGRPLTPSHCRDRLEEMMAARTRSKRAPATAHQFGAILEEVRSQQTAMLEAISAWGERLERKFDVEFSRVNERLDNLEAAVRQNSLDIKKNSDDIRRLNAEVADLRAEVRQLRTDFDGRHEKAQIAVLEARVTRLEQHVKIG